MIDADGEVSRRKDQGQGGVAVLLGDIVFKMWSDSPLEGNIHRG